MEVEVWKFIEGFPFHMISNYGRILNVKYNKFIKVTLKLEPVNKRYFRYKAVISHKKIVKNVSVHILVAKAFVNNPNNYTKLIDNNPENIKSSNLTWISDKEYWSMWRTTLPESLPFYGNKEKPIVAFNPTTKHKIEFNSIMETASYFKTRHDYINKVLKGIFKTHKSYTFTRL